MDHLCGDEKKWLVTLPEEQLFEGAVVCIELIATGLVVEYHYSMMDAEPTGTVQSADCVVVVDCCADCDCSAGGCTAAVLPAFRSVFSPNLALSGSHYIELAENHLTDFLFRPPISR